VQKRNFNKLEQTRNISTHFNILQTLILYPKHDSNISTTDM